MGKNKRPLAAVTAGKDHPVAPAQKKQKVPTGLTFTMLGSGKRTIDTATSTDPAAGSYLAKNFAAICGTDVVKLAQASQWLRSLGSGNGLTERQAARTAIRKKLAEGVKSRYQVVHEKPATGDPMAEVIRKNFVNVGAAYAGEYEFRLLGGPAEIPADSKPALPPALPDLPDPADVVRTLAELESTTETKDGRLPGFRSDVAKIMLGHFSVPLENAATRLRQLDTDFFAKWKAYLPPLRRNDFSDQAFAVQLTLIQTAERPRISQVLVGRRPPGLYGGADKSHLTGWQTFVDGVRNRVVGRTPAQAYQEVLKLGAHAEALQARKFAPFLRAQGLNKPEPIGPPPKVEADTDDAEAQAEIEIGNPRSWYDRAGAHWVQTSERLDTLWRADSKAGPRMELLQDLIAAYLHFRNTMPLTAVRENFPRGAAARMEEWERLAAKRALTPAEIREAFADAWKQFDHRAMDNLFTKETAFLFGADAPKVEVPQARLAAVCDHITSMEAYYPALAAQKVMRARNPPFPGAPTLANMAAGLESPIAGPPAPEPDPDTSEYYDRFALQLGLNYNRTVIKKMYVGSRPEAGRGRHSTAWVVLCDYVRALVVGHNVSDVPALLAEEYAVIAELADAAGLAAAGLAIDKMLDPTGKTLFETAQVQISRFLSLLNQLPVAIVETGGTSPGGAESRYRKKIRDGQATETTLAAMLDPKPLKFIQDHYRGDESVSFRVGLHLHMMDRAYGQYLKTLRYPLWSERSFALLLSRLQTTIEAAEDRAMAVWNVLSAGRLFDEEEFEDHYKEFLRLKEPDFTDERDEDDSTSESASRSPASSPEIEIVPDSEMELVND